MEIALLSLTLSVKSSEKSSLTDPTEKSDTKLLFITMFAGTLWNWNEIACCEVFSNKTSHWVSSKTANVV